MITCPACNRTTPDDFAFCPRCGAALAAPSATTDERKVVTTLFCDLVAFTAMSETADPEDVDSVLRTYHAAARRVIESHGGTVEKFIGDAVVGVFGVPAAHEDDSERAVRAGLRIVEALDGMSRPDGSPLEIRVGVNTGEALVRLDVTPGSGEGFLAGDAVNSAARLQAAATPGSVLVGVLTHALTAQIFEYADLPPVVAKGKAEPLRAWVARRPIARTGLRTAGLTATRFVGREDELGELETALRRTAQAGESQVVLVVGEPGIGKSRLLLEFARLVDSRSDLVTWRQGRCLPYGEGVAFWALGEIVKQQTGILDSDDVATVEAKLAAALPEGDTAWLRERLRPLLGRATSSQAEREESFHAWGRFLELIAARGPTVLVFEDLHWAGEGMLAFVEHLLSRDLDAPLLIVATSRPELLLEHQGSLTAARGADRPQRITLQALPQEKAEELVADLLDADWACGAGTRVIELAGGNPLYAEQYVRLLRDRGLIGAADKTAPLGKNEELPQPETVQAVIAARLDALPPEDKSLLCDAAVYGEAFWRGGVAALADRDQNAIDESTASLIALGLIRPGLSSTLEGEPEYLFWHALTRDAAYRLLPRRLRAVKHQLAARWLETVAGENLEDLAEIIAHHCTAALGYARAVHDDQLAESMLEPTVRYLGLAGDRALGLDPKAAERYYSQAVELRPQRDCRRAHLLLRLGDALLYSEQIRPAMETCAEASELFLAGDDKPSAAAALARCSDCLWFLGDNGALSLAERAVSLIADSEPSKETVKVNEQMAILTQTLGYAEEALPYFDRSLAHAELAGLPTPLVALQFRAYGRCERGDKACLDDMQDALTMALNRGTNREVFACYQGLGYCRGLWEGFAVALTIHEAGRGYFGERGLGDYHRILDSLVAWDNWLIGEWDAATSEALALEPALAQAEDVLSLSVVRAVLAFVLSARGDHEAATARAQWLREARARLPDLQIVGMSLAAAAAAFLAAGEREAATECLWQCQATPGIQSNSDYICCLTETVRTTLRSADARLARRMAAGVQPWTPMHKNGLAGVAALLEADDAEAARKFAVAASRWRDFGVPYEEGHALLGQGRSLFSIGRSSEAAEPLAAARAIFDMLGAAPAVGETDRLISQLATA